MVTERRKLKKGGAVQTWPTGSEIIGMKSTLVKTDKLGRTQCESCRAWLDISDYRIFEEGECPDCGVCFSVPGKLGKYYLLEELGRGGMGAVFLAKDQDLQRLVALKVLKEKYGKDPDFYDGLVREAKAAAALNHRNIVQIFTFGQEKQQPYIVMELVLGKRLDERMDEDVPLDELEVLDILRQITGGLAAADAIGLVHGDIKPANILINEKGIAKLADFGVARFDGGGKGRIFGTPLYIAPEKARGFVVDGRSDQFCLGASFWHVLSNRPPYPGRTSAKVVLERFKSRPPLLHLVRPDVSEATSHLLRKMMELKPEDRFENYSAVAQEITRILEDVTSSRAEQAQQEKEAEKSASRLFSWPLKRR